MCSCSYSNTNSNNNDNNNNQSDGPARHADIPGTGAAGGTSVTDESEEDEKKRKLLERFEADQEAKKIRLEKAQQMKDEKAQMKDEKAQMKRPAGTGGKKSFKAIMDEAENSVKTFKNDLQRFYTLQRSYDKDRNAKTAEVSEDDA